MRQGVKVGIAMLAKALLEAALYRRVMPAVAGIVMLLLLSLCLLAASGAVLIYQLYLMLMDAGLGQQQALAVMVCGMLAVAAASAMIAMRKLEALHARLQPLSDIKEKLICAAHAFGDGFQGGK